MAYTPLTKVPVAFLGTGPTFLNGGVLYAYEAGTSTPATMYSDDAGTSAGTSVTLDSRGEPTTIKQIWLDTTVDYKFVLKDSAGTTIWTVDDIKPDGFGQMIEVANITALKALDTSIYTTAYVKAHTTAGDGGHGWFYYASGSSDTDDNGAIIQPDSGGGRWLRNFAGDPYAEMWGAVGDDSTDNTAIINTAITYCESNTGVLRIGKGTFVCTDTIELNNSNMRLIGSGADVTILKAAAALPNTLLESNNGSWTDTTSTYSSTGTSLGMVCIESMTLSGSASTSCTGLALARFTLGCSVKDVKITGFDINARVYGCWYSNFYNVVFENAVDTNMIIDYESNDVSFFGCDWTSNPASQSAKHIEGPGGGTCRNVNFYGCGFDGLPTSYGIRLKNFQQTNFVGGYWEVYNAEVTKTANFLECNTNVDGLMIEGVLMIAGTSYSGTWVKCAIDASNFGKNISFNGCFQYNGDTNTSVAVDTTNSESVTLGNSRVEKTVTIGHIDEVLPNKESHAYIPATSSSAEVKIPIATIRNGYSVPVTVIKMKAVTGGSTLATQYMRIQDTAGTPNVFIDYPMPTTINAGDEFYLTDDSGSGYVTTTGETAINTAKTIGTKLEAYTYKVGAAQDWPDFTITVEQF